MRDNLEVMPGDGAGLSADQVETKLKDVMEETMRISQDISRGSWNRREWADDIRYCRWNGQSPDGKKRKRYMRKKAFPFEGASDNRVRLADEIINIKTEQLVSAALGMQKTITGMEIKDTGYVGRLRLLADWIIENQLGSEYNIELKRAANWHLGDSPGLCVVGVHWFEDVQLEDVEMTLEEIIAEMSALWEAELGEPALPTDVDFFIDTLVATDRRDEGQSLLEMLFDIGPKTAARLVKQTNKANLGEDDAGNLQVNMQHVVNFPQPYAATSVPRITAHRLHEEFFMPSDTRHLQRSRLCVTREWLTESELRDRAASEGYTDSWLQKMLHGEAGDPDGVGTRGRSSIDTADNYNRDQIVTDTGIDDESATRYERHYELLTAWFKATNEDGVTGVYFMPYSGHIKNEPAHAPRLSRHKHGKYPFVIIPRECLTQRITQSRGISEITKTDQYALKLLVDSFNDSASLRTVPPLLVDENRSEERLDIGPMNQIPKAPNEVLEWMSPPEYPQTAGDWMKMHEQRVARYHGLPADGVPDQVVATLNQGMVNTFLAGWRDVLVMMLQLAQQYMAPEDIYMATGGEQNPFPIEDSREQIQGNFSMKVSYDVRVQNPEYVERLLKVVREFYVPLDKRNTLRYDAIMRWAMNMIDPNQADALLQDPEEGTADEQRDELNNWMMIMTGVGRPPMDDTVGNDWPTRFEVATQVTQSPSVQAALQQDQQKAQLAEERMKFLQHQVTQLQNADTGRTGTPETVPAFNVPNPAGA